MDDFAPPDDRMTRRIAARLLALADVADCVDRLPLPLRWLFLWVLRRAEARALDYVVSEAEASGLFVWTGPLPGDERPDGALLALRLRELAAVLFALVAPLPGAPSRFRRRRPILRLHGFARPPAPGAMSVSASVPAPDTS